MVHFIAPDMNPVIISLKMALFVLIGVVSIGMIGAGLIAFPNPDSAFQVGIGVLCLLLIWCAWVLNPAPSQQS